MIGRISLREIFARVLSSVVRVKTDLTILFALSLAFATATASFSQEEDKGAILVDKHACKNCHLINGNGGTVGPPLDGISEHRSEGHIIYKLLQGQTLPAGKKPSAPMEMMPHVHVPHSDVLAITKYLQSLPPRSYRTRGHEAGASADRPAGSSFKPEKSSASSTRGMSLFRDKGCFACHSISGAGGSYGPELDGIGARRSRNFISNRVTRGALILPEPNEKSGQVSMPAAKLSTSEINDITSWLMTVPAKKDSR